MDVQASMTVVDLRRTIQHGCPWAVDHLCMDGAALRRASDADFDRPADPGQDAETLETLAVVSHESAVGLGQVSHDAATGITIVRLVGNDVEGALAYVAGGDAGTGTGGASHGGSEVPTAGGRGRATGSRGGGEAGLDAIPGVAGRLR